ncbi:hypothetical protein PQX77_020681 [Marasmius sp. AFHP31]|nr:hypothetical protein PQX77_020681 [Marasmius sp. AFHP31]
MPEVDWYAGHHNQCSEISELRKNGLNTPFTQNDSIFIQLIIRTFISRRTKELTDSIELCRSSISSHAPRTYSDWDIDKALTNQSLNPILFVNFREPFGPGDEEFPIEVMDTGALNRSRTSADVAQVMETWERLDAGQILVVTLLQDSGRNKAFQQQFVVGYPLEER